MKFSIFKAEKSLYIAWASFHELPVYFQKTLVWLQKREDRLKEFQPVAGNFDTIKDQWNEVKVTNLSNICSTISVFVGCCGKGCRFAQVKMWKQ